MTNPSRGELVPGGLAITKVDDLLLPAWSCVELVRRLNTGDRVTQNFFAPSPGWVCKRDGVKGTLAFADFELMPINPEPDPLEITQHQEQSA